MGFSGDASDDRDNDRLYEWVHSHRDGYIVFKEDSSLPVWGFREEGNVCFFSTWRFRSSQEFQAGKLRDEQDGSAN